MPASGVLAKTESAALSPTQQLTGSETPTEGVAAEMSMVQTRVSVPEMVKVKLPAVMGLPTR